jgi:hypothetical protein
MRAYGQLERCPTAPAQRRSFNLDSHRRDLDRLAERVATPAITLRLNPRLDPQMRHR